MLLHDAQYTEEEYAARVGWGHSAVAHAVTFAKLADAKRLVLFHHDPLHSDSRLEAMLASARELWGGIGTPLALAYEGMVLDVS